MSQAVRERGATTVGRQTRGGSRSGGGGRGGLWVVLAGLAILALVITAGRMGASGWEGEREPAPAVDPGGATAAAALGDLTTAFVANAGQLDERVHFHARGTRYGIYATTGGVVLALEQEHHGPSVVTAADSGPGMALELRFLGADPDSVEGAEPVSGEVHYLRGEDPNGWHTGLPRYASVVYRDLWPGVDGVIREQDGELKYEFRVQPGARVDDIRLAYAGADGLALDADGALRIATPLGDFRDAPPESWQVVDGARVPVGSGYVLDGPEYGFAVGDHDPGLELVVDPGLDYATFIGGAQTDSFGDLAVAGDGSAYVVGHSVSTDFPTTSGAFDRTHNGGVLDVVVAKLHADGSGLAYATYLGGTTCPGENPYDMGFGVAVDDAGHAYVTGVTTSPNFPTTSGAFQTEIGVHAPTSTCEDAFVTKLDPSGSSLAYSTFLGGTSQDSGRGIAIDATGSAYVVGDTCSTSFPVTPGAFQTARGAGCAAFLAKLDPSGSDLDYATFLGGSTDGESSDTSIANAVAVDAAGSAYVAGATRARDFPTTPAAFQETHPGGDFVDLFTGYVVKVTPAGDALAYSTFLGGTKREFVRDVAVDGSGEAHVVGGTLSPEFPTTEGAFDPSSGPGSFLTKLAADGTDLVWSTLLAGASGSALALDGDGSVWVAGGNGGGAAPTTEDAFSRENAGGGDAWLGRLSADGSSLLHGTYFGGVASESAGGVALDDAGAVYIAGRTSSFDLPTTLGAFQPTLAGEQDLFVARFGDGVGEPGPEPPPPTRTDTWSGEIDKNQTIRHFANVEERGTVEIHLDWDEPRVDLDLRVIHLPSSTVVFTDTSGDRPKDVAFEASMTGLYGYDVINNVRRRADYVLEVTSPVPTTTHPPSLSSIELDPDAVLGGETATGRVHLTAAAREGGEEVALTSSDPDVVSVPASVTVPAGATSGTFPVATTSVAASTTATITATYEGTSRAATLAVTAEGGPELATLTVDPNPVSSGGTATGTVTLTAAAPAGGAVVALASSNTFVATVPDGVTVPAGATSATFTVSASTVTSDQSSAITAAYAGETRTVILAVEAEAAEDSVTIERARYDRDKGELEVRARSSHSSAVLTVYPTGSEEPIGTLSDGRGTFRTAEVSHITVRSSLGGSDSASVEMK